MNIVLLSLLLSRHLSFMPIGKTPSFTAKQAVEALDKQILPKAIGLDIHCVVSTIAQPLLERVRNEFWVIVPVVVVGCPRSKNNQSSTWITWREASGGIIHDYYRVATQGENQLLH